MIFITVGTHEQQFNRLIKAADEIGLAQKISEEIIIQTGYSTYKPTACTYSDFFPYQKMKDLVEEARIVITHGGPSSFFMPLEVGKVPIVVPRQKKYGEHVNDHQVSFCRAVSERQGNIILLENVNMLYDTINQYDKIVSTMATGINSNNVNFCKGLDNIVNEMNFDKRGTRH